MKIAIIGYGKMGKTIEQLALQKGHEIYLKIDDNNLSDLTTKKLKGADVAIEFTQPNSAFHNIKAALAAGIPIISGTTGWLDRKEEAINLCKQSNGALFYASNYSVGVNIFFAVNRRLADLMDRHPNYDISMEEIHHTQKLDSPSGTAITLAEGIITNIKRKDRWVSQYPKTSKDLVISSKRIDKVPGTHSICYESDVDSIEIKHTAHSRLGFASGALMAAEWILGKKGFYGMDDMLGF